ncbi:hypothetical protein TNCT_337461 [Trichonephila clavata]|uniref:Uncharacterized protein n=1 Tax=Trichonephila clavata TaxID=2740835 RepID=A0A8X6IZ78_TRICU|nr:hypothetical protein TNCT_337461 [Trichonephila clavata]
MNLHFEETRTFAIKPVRCLKLTRIHRTEKGLLQRGKATTKALLGTYVISRNLNMPCSTMRGALLDVLKCPPYKIIPTRMNCFQLIRMCRKTINWCMTLKDYVMP